MPASNSGQARRQGVGRRPVPSLLTLRHCPPESACEQSLYFSQSSCQSQPWILLLRESHGPRDVGTGGASELGVTWGPEDDVISSLTPSLCPAAMERQGHGAHGHPCGQPQTLLSHSQCGRHHPAECEQIPLCDPFRWRLWCVQLR